MTKIVYICRNVFSLQLHSKRSGTIEGLQVGDKALVLQVTHVAIYGTTTRRRVAYYI